MELGVCGSGFGGEGCVGGGERGLASVADCCGELGCGVGDEGIESRDRKRVGGPLEGGRSGGWVRRYAVSYPPPSFLLSLLSIHTRLSLYYWF